MNKPANIPFFTLSFTGGPLDGYREQTDCPLHELPEVLGILISPRIVEMLTTQRKVGEMPPTSLAFYQQTSPQVRQYSFVGSTFPEVLEFDDQKQFSK